MEPSQPPIAPPNPQPPETPARQPRHKKPLLANAKAFLSVLAFVGSVILAATLINHFIFQSYYVDGTSMTPTLRNNDRLIIDKVERSIAMLGGKHYIPERGQIVVLDSSLVDRTGHNEQLIKRVIGLPGETIDITTEGKVTIRNKDNPEGFDPDATLGLNLATTFVDAPVSITIPENQVFVMGDNRAPGGSFDSRSFGPVSSDKIQGRLIVRIFPLNETKIF